MTVQPDVVDVAAQLFVAEHGTSVCLPVGGDGTTRQLLTEGVVAVRVEAGEPLFRGNPLS